MNDGSRVSAALSDDTVDLQLTPEQMLELSQAAETAAVAAPAPTSEGGLAFVRFLGTSEVKEIFVSAGIEQPPEQSKPIQFVGRISEA